MRSLDRLRRNVEGCDLCPDLVESRTRIVFGDGPDDADWVVVGESPGATEDKVGSPFRGKAGRKARMAMVDEGLDPESAFWTNVLLCHPEKNRDPRPEEVRNCSLRLILTLSILRPKVVLTFGLPSFKALAGVTGRVSMSEYRGRRFRYRVKTRSGGYLDTVLVPTYHPAYIARPTGKPYEADWREDLRLVRRLLERSP